MKVPKIMEILMQGHTATSVAEILPTIFRICPQFHSLQQIPSRDIGSQGIPLFSVEQEVAFPFLSCK